MFSVTSILGLGLAALLIYILRPKQHDPREPPLIPSKIPVIGHLVSFFYYGLQYYLIQSTKHPLPMFTMDMVFNKVYIVTSPRFVSSVRRNHRSMSFDPLLTRVAKCVAGIQGSGLKLLRGKEFQGQGLGHEVVLSMRPALIGNGLDKMNQAMIDGLLESIETMASDSNSNKPIDLYDWCQTTITVASTNAVYGELNPYRTSRIQNAFWDMESNIISLLIGVAPWLIARKGWKGREELVKAFIEYYQADGHLESSLLAYDRWKAQHDAGATIENIARLEAVTGLGILANTVPTCFWLIFDIYSRPELLEEIRNEIRQNAVHVDSEHSQIIKLADIRDKCPLLLSTYQEVLRLRGNSGQVRLLHEDVVLEDTYLVKADSILLMPGGVINTDKSVWGENAQEFEPRRFVNSGSDKRDKSSAFMSFGVSPSVCPGRHFATGEILALTALLFLKFDIVPVSGSWAEPKTRADAVASVLPPPTQEVRVIATEREEVKGVKWSFRVTPGKGMHGLIIG